MDDNTASSDESEPQVTHRRKKSKHSTTRTMTVEEVDDSDDSPDIEEVDEEVDDLSMDSVNIDKVRLSNYLN